MNQFLIATKQVMQAHLQAATYTKVTTGTYNIETGSVTNTETNYSVSLYKKHIVANQYNYPNLIGKDVARFYLINESLAFTPSVNDRITFGSDTYTVDSLQSHTANGEVLLYRIIAVKS